MRMKQDSSALSRRSTNRAGGLFLVMAAASAMLFAFGSRDSVLAAKPKAAAPPVTDRQPTTPAAGWTAANEFNIAGSYAEACTDPPLCPGIFGSDRPGAGCRKVMFFHVQSGTWHGTNLADLRAVVVAEAPDGRAVGAASRDAWSSSELWLPEQADSAKAEGLRRSLGLMLFGPGGPEFSRVDRVPLAAGLSNTRIFVEAVGRLRMNLVPAPSINGHRPPDLNNVGRAFRFLGPMMIFDADTLYCAPTGREATTATHRSALTAPFGWSSEAAYAGMAASDGR